MEIISGKQPGPRRIFMYGGPGTGKSTFAAAAPGAVFIPTEDGLKDIDCRRFPLCRSYADILNCIGQLYSEQHDFKYAVLDSADWAQRMIWADVCEKRGVKNIEDIGFKKGYTFAMDQWQELFSGFDALVADRGMSIIVIAHVEIAKFDDPMRESYHQFCPRLHSLPEAYICEWADEILFASTKIFTKKTDEGFNKEKHRAFSDGERVMYTSDRPSYKAKNRLGLPDQMPLDWNAYAKYLTA